MMSRRAKRRADRQIAIVEELGRGLTTAERIAERLNVCERTIYRDIHALRREGVRIIGESGMGYELRRRSP